MRLSHTNLVHSSQNHRMMRLLVFSAIFLFAETTCSYHADIGIPEAKRIKRAEEALLSSRVTGGYFAYLGAYPFFGGLLISIDANTTSVCGASLISNTKLVTAAHCWNDGVLQAVSVEVVLGSIRLFSGGKRVTTIDVDVHSDYNPQSIRNDIAIITMDMIQLNSFIQPISLPSERRSFVNVSCEVVGFGRVSEDIPISVNQQLSRASLTVISNEECALAYGQLITDSSICTIGSPVSGPCGGDSGGPIFYSDGEKNVLIGVVSFGSSYGCEAGHPSSHSRVTSYLDWIQSKL